MNRLKATIARTPVELAGAIGLPAAAAKEWQVQHVLLKSLKKSRDARRSLTPKSRDGQAHHAPA